jgi:hypothetical protein
MTHMIWLMNLHPQNIHIIDAQICDGLQKFQWKMDLLLLAFHCMCKIQLVLAQKDHLTPLYMI